jgi:hypothetical protein
MQATTELPEHYSYSRELDWTQAGKLSLRKCYKNAQERDIQMLASVPAQNAKTIEAAVLLSFRQYMLLE